MERLLRLAAQGINIGFEFGIDIDPRMKDLIDTTMEEQVVSIKEMIRLGLINHLILSQDVCFQSALKKMAGMAIPIWWMKSSRGSAG